RAGRTGHHLTHRAAAHPARRVVRGDHAVGDPPGRLVQALRWQAAVPDGAAAAPFRAQRLGRSHHRHPVLDHRRHVRRPGPGRVLRRMGGRIVSGKITWLDDADRHSPWAQLSVVVAGLGVSGYAAADALMQLGARVTVVDERDGDAERERGTILEVLDVDVRLGPGSTATLPPGTDLVVTSPGWRPNAPLLTAAAAAG